MCRHIGCGASSFAQKPAEAAARNTPEKLAGHDSEQQNDFQG
jgi:hypothetical protein